MKRWTCVALVSAFALVGCGGAPAPEPAAPPTPADTYAGEVIEVPAGPVTPATPTPTPTPAASAANALTIAPSRQLMATMECESLDDVTAAELRRKFGGNRDEAVMVEIGEGLTPGEKWWFVVAQVDPEPTGPRRFITNRPGLAADADGLWISSINEHEVVDGLRRYKFRTLKWDDPAMIERAQSAANVAMGCFPA